MAGPGIDREELRKWLEKMVELLEQKGMLPPGIDKNTLITNVLDNLEKNNCEISMDDLAHREKGDVLRKSLMLALVSEATAVHTKDPDKKFDYTKFFKTKDEPLDQEQIKQELKVELKKLLNFMNDKMDPNEKKSDKELDDIADKLAEDLTKKFMQDKDYQCHAQQKDAFDLFAEIMLAVSCIYGGVRPDQAGGFIRPVQQTSGNYSAIPSFTPKAEGGTGSLMEQVNDVEPGNYNYTGAENNAITNAISAGGLMEELVEMLVADDLMRPAGIASRPPQPHHP